MDEVELARLRRDYEAAGLVEADLPGDPMVLFHDWLDCAADAKLAEANAMVVATVDAVETGAEAPGYELISAVVKTGSRLAIWLSTRI